MKRPRCGNSQPRLIQPTARPTTPWVCGQHSGPTRFRHFPISMPCSAIDANDARARTGRARAFFYANRLSEALRESEIAVALDPTDPAARQVHGTMLEHSGYHMEAAAEYAFATEGCDIREGRLIGLYQDRNPWLEMAQRSIAPENRAKPLQQSMNSWRRFQPVQRVAKFTWRARSTVSTRAIMRQRPMTSPRQQDMCAIDTEAAALGFRRAILLQKVGMPDQARRERKLLLRGG